MSVNDTTSCSFDWCLFVLGDELSGGDADFVFEKTDEVLRILEAERVGDFSHVFSALK